MNNTGHAPQSSGFENDEEHTADMNIAMTGDMVIRIAQGTTVARGDLLMSAGVNDGRSKTIAKASIQKVAYL